MQTISGNLFGDLPTRSENELVATLVTAPGIRIERIVSTGQASPPDFWYDQDWAEWVLVVSGSAAVLFEGDPEPHPMTAGDYLLIPAHRRHRVEWTDAAVPTVWLAVHFDDTAGR